METETYVVLDIGKTIAKLSLWEKDGKLLNQKSRTNEICNNGYFQCLDIKGIENWLFETLAEFAKTSKIKAIIPATHGAAIAIIKNNKLAIEPMDYEWQIPLKIKEEYEAQRDDFAHNLSPNMEFGLNIGAQLYFLKKEFPNIFEGEYQILPFAQYWAWLLSGVACSEISSFGAHSDLWSIPNNTPSNMATKLGFAAHFAPFKKANETIGPLKSDLAEKLRIETAPDIYVGIHDSNAALHLMRKHEKLKNQDFTIISTGTWFVFMQSLNSGVKIDFKKLAAQNGVLCNIDIAANAVPTALIMGGREIEILRNDFALRLDLPQNQEAILNAVEEIIQNESYILPSPIAGIGPFPNSKLEFINASNASKDEIKSAALIALYMACLCDYALDCLNETQNIVIEGRFAQSDAITKILAKLRPNINIYCSKAEANIGFGALCLALNDLKPLYILEKIVPFNGEVCAYRNAWRNLVLTKARL